MTPYVHGRLIFYYYYFARLSVTTPCVINYALGYGAFLGLYTNIRYQLLCGFDRNYFGIIGLALFFSSTALRYTVYKHMVVVYARLNFFPFFVRVQTSFYSDSSRFGCTCKRTELRDSKILRAILTQK